MLYGYRRRISLKNPVCQWQTGFFMEQGTGVEPASEAWEATIIADILTLRDGDYSTAVWKKQAEIFDRTWGGKTFFCELRIIFPFVLLFRRFTLYWSYPKNEVIPMIKQLTKRRRPLLRLCLTFLMVLLSGCCLGLLSLYFSAGDHGLYLFRWYLTQPMVMVLNLLPFVLLVLLMYAALDRAWLAFLVSGAVGLFFSWAQYWKLMARNDPIYAGDLLILSEATQMAGQYVNITWQIVLSAVLVLVAVGCLFFLAKGRMKKPLPRVALAAAVVALGFWLYPKYYTDAATYNSMTVWPEISQWFETNRYISRGGIYPFIHSIPDALPTPPEGYEEETARDILAAYPSDDIPEDKKVSLVVTQLEAFADLSTAMDRITGVDPYAEFHAIQAESYHGTLMPNVFGGGTIDTERCVLTGFSALEEFRRPSWSYARYFLDQGYTVEGAHAGYEAFYNRVNINANLGMPSYRFVENYYHTMVESVPYDNVFLPDVTENVLAAMDNGPVFSFNVTYQNHGPYSLDYACFSDVYVPQEDLSSADWHIINNYLWGVQDTGRRMQTMVDRFRDIDEPVVLVFFGDHKPWLGDQSVTYDALGIDIRGGTEESFRNYYATEYLIWANDAAKAVLGTELVGEGPEISPCFLMNLVFEQCGWEGPGYTKFTDEVRSQLPVLHTTRWNETEGMTDEQLALRDRMTQIQYYLAMDAAGVHP